MRRGTAPRADHTAAIERALSAAAPSPLALVGRSGCGKTHLLRTQFALRGVQPTWTTARDLVQSIVGAIQRSGRGTDTLLADDPRPLVVEHLEDLRGMPRTLQELRLLLEARHRA
jgi:chromosomal replication initiation ATPase DnaA